MPVNKPPYPQFPVLQSDTIIMRQVLHGDIKDLIEISYYDGIPATNEIEATAMQNRIDQDYLEGNSIHWVIIDKQSKALTGTCGYYRGFANNAGELGCVLRPQYQGKGYMTAAMILAIDFGLNQMGLEKIIAITSQQNLKSRSLLERVGFVKTKELADDDMWYEYVPLKKGNQPSFPLQGVRGLRGLA